MNTGVFILRTVDLFNSMNTITIEWRYMLILKLDLYDKNNLQI